MAQPGNQSVGQCGTELQLTFDYFVLFVLVVLRSTQRLTNKHVLCNDTHPVPDRVTVMRQRLDLPVLN